MFNTPGIMSCVTVVRASTKLIEVDPAATDLAHSNINIDIGSPGTLTR
jgi:hypothetical protein